MSDYDTRQFDMNPHVTRPFAVVGVSERRVFPTVVNGQKNFVYKDKMTFEGRRAYLCREAVGLDRKPGNFFAFQDSQLKPLDSEANDVFAKEYRD